MTMQFSSWQTIKERLRLYRKLTLRAMNKQGEWLHLNGREFTQNIHQRWLGTESQFHNINELYNGELIPVKADKPKFTFRDGN